MKKIAVFVTVLTLACGIFGCGSKAQESAPAESTVESVVESAEESTVEAEAAEESEAVESEEASEEPVECELEDGVYEAEFVTDSSMFHINEACEGLGILTVENGHMTIHVSLVSKNIVNLFPGTADEAQAEGAVLLEPTTDEVTYSDGETEEVYGFDIPVPVIGEDFDCALIGTKGKWYDHKVSVQNPVLIEE
ncbi:MAG: hypothetical protein KBS83_01905 [Lachnospiraceae bacterium]|nr:hypothetical protein [Candidatus Equihabitans merdae]